MEASSVSLSSLSISCKKNKNKNLNLNHFFFYINFPEMEERASDRESLIHCIEQLERGTYLSSFLKAELLHVEFHFFFFTWSTCLFFTLFFFNFL